jgi:inner membrane protein
VASVGHVIVGLAAGRFWAGPGAPAPRLVAAMVGFSALSLSPDADVISFALGVPYADPFGHRGASHSIVFALVLGALVGLVQRLRGGEGALKLGALSAAVVVSHPLLDAMTTGGLGVAWAWPWSAERAFLPWRPIPVSPIGAGFLSSRGLKVALTEVAQLAPLWLWALWPRRAS